MSEYRIIFEKAAVKFLRRQDKPTQERLLRAINNLPNGTDIKKLQGYTDLYRLRVGDIRIIYILNKVLKIINIENINSRGDVYKNL